MSLYILIYILRLRLKAKVYEFVVEYLEKDTAAHRAAIKQIDKLRKG